MSDKNPGSLNVWQVVALWLAQKHRREQDSIADTVGRGVGRAWRHLDFDRLDESTEAWIDATVPTVQAGYERSQRSTVRFIDDYRRVAAFAKSPDARTPAPPPRWTQRDDFEGRATTPLREGRQPLPEMDTRRLIRALGATGPGRVKRAMPAPREVAMAKGLKGAVGASIESAMTGGREVTQLEVARDGLAVGYQRVTDGDPCAFCALLAANGPVFTRESFKYVNDQEHVTRRADKRTKFLPNVAFEATGEPDGIAKVHNFCRCTLIPVYSEFDLADPVGTIASEIWTEVSGYTGDTFKNYQKVYRQVRKNLGPVSGLEVQSDEVVAAILDGLENLENGTSDGAKYLRSLRKQIA